MNVQGIIAVTPRLVYLDPSAPLLNMVINIGQAYGLLETVSYAASAHGMAHIQRGDACDL